MFYSHTFLARKSPLGTVWIAAHLQHKIRRNHVSVTDIGYTVDYIMTSEVPIALRMQAYLLLGVVRIYSRKVDYLYHDCNEIMSRIRTAFASTKEIDLPEGETHANFESITLPETFELDALELDDAPCHEGDMDNHLRDQEEITLTDQIPAEGDPYVTFFNVEDFRMEISPPDDIPDTGVRSMDEDIPCSLVNSGVGVSNYVPVDRLDESSEKAFEDRFEKDPGEIERMRDFTDIVSDHFDDSFNLGNDFTEHHQPLQHQSATGKGILSPIVEDPPHSGRQCFPLQPHTDPPSTGGLPEPLENFNTSASPGFGLGNVSLDLALQPTPPIEKKKANTRKRKQNFDTTIVLSNQFMKERLEDASGLVRKRKNLPCSALDVWIFKKRSRKDQVFLDYSNSGLCADLQDIPKKEFMKVHTHPEEGTYPEDRAADSSLPIPESDTVHTVPVGYTNPETRDASSTVPMPEIDEEIECFRFEGDQNYDNYVSECMPSPIRRDDFTPFLGTDRNSEPPTGSQLHTELTVEQTVSTEPMDSDMGTPMTPFDPQFSIGRSGLSDIPELNTAEGEELCFLDADNTQVEGQAESGSLQLSTRARDMHQYLINQSPRTEGSKHPAGKLSLNKILEGKTRKKCARMFYETLVLKSCMLIDVEQEEAYGDIILHPISKAIF
ncbi:Sister chromatid cohesion 1 protein [Thalictrum thalictroides]|uniref:Sister chromatid cohesion 1 protein n=1 Tax=Thalictrum thalictroides TaxID=46969 RepID=A0A7J6WIW1_THATH|nr:Sister chromatid cohesion 1 protein [Thalictrum thalictroides]